MSNNNQYDIVKIQIDMEKQKVTHILHLILSLITCGFWLIVWLIVTVSASIERSRLNAKLKVLMNNNN